MGARKGYGLKLLNSEADTVVFLRPLLGAREGAEQRLHAPCRLHRRFDVEEADPKARPGLACSGGGDGLLSAEDEVIGCLLDLCEGLVDRLLCVWTSAALTLPMSLPP